MLASPAPLPPHQSPPDNRDATRRWEAILANIGDHFVTYDREWRFTYINEAGARMLGKTAAELIGRNIWEIFPDAVGNQYYRELHTALAEQRIIRSEHYYAPFGKWFENFIYPTPEGVTVFATDVTARKTTEQQLLTARAGLEEHARLLEARVAERTRELQQKVAELEAFSYSLSHDLRAPLRALSGYASVLLAEYGAQSAPAARDYSEKIQRAALRLDQLIVDVLSYHRVSREEVRLTRVELNPLLDEIVAEREPLQAIRAQIQIAPALPAVRGHESLLTQCFSNLLENAAKFVRPGQAPHVEIFAQSRGSSVRVFVRDHGIGVPPEHAERIFGIFERLHMASAYPGTGIGLAIVRRAVERMRGNAGVESDGVHGSTFWIELPAADCAEPASQQ